MRALLFCLAGLLTASPDFAFAQAKPPAKAATNANEIRYFTSLDGLMDGHADVVLKETRLGKTVTAAVLDVCYPAEKGSVRMDRFVANLAVSGQNLTGTTQSIDGKLPVTVKLVRKPTGDTFEFRGQISVGPAVTEVVSTDNSDLSEKEYLESQTSDDGITATPKDFTEVSPESVGVRIKLESALEFLKTLKGEALEVSLSSLSVSCDALRAGEQTLYLNVDPERSAALIAKAKAAPGVVAAGWTSGAVEMDRTIRFAAADWREGGKLNREKLAATISDVLSRTLAAKPASSAWDANSGKLKLTLKRPSQVAPALGLTETLEVTALVSADKPGTSDRLMLWLGSPSVSTADEGSGPKLNLAEETSLDEEAEQTDDNGSVAALAKEFRAQVWDGDNNVWK